jgi:hypothetical protein
MRESRNGRLPHLGHDSPGGPQEFAVTVSAVPDPASEQIDSTAVDARTVNARALAIEACADLVLRILPG